MNECKIIFYDINSLIGAEYNPRKISDKQLEDLKDSIKRFGFVEPVVINTNQERKNIIISGHQRVRVAKDMSIKAVPCIEVNLTPEKEKELNIRMNKSGGEFDIDALKEFFEIGDLIDWGFEEEELNFSIDAEEKDDEVPELPETPKTKLGDIYILGNHRVMCGDSTKIDDVEKLMDGNKADLVVTDPPYNTGMKGKNDSTRLSHMFNDNFTPEQWESFLKNVFDNYFVYTKGECVFYVFIDWRRVSDIRSELERLMDVKNVIVWDKEVHGLGSDYKSTYELCVVGKKGNPEIKNRFGRDYQDIWRVQRKMGKNKDHATAKPIELLEKPVLHGSKMDDVVLDLFLGSGSTLIACEKTNRICYGMEIDPKYCDVIVKRWEEFTGEKAVLQVESKVEKNG